MEGVAMDSQGMTGGEQFHTHYCCVLHPTDASLVACTRDHYYTADLSLVAYAVHLEVEAEKKGRKKRQTPTDHGA